MNKFLDLKYTINRYLDLFVKEANKCDCFEFYSLKNIDWQRKYITFLHNIYSDRIKKNGIMDSSKKAGLFIERFYSAEFTNNCSSARYESIFTFKKFMDVLFSLKVISEDEYHFYIQMIK